MSHPPQTTHHQPITLLLALVCLAAVGTLTTVRATRIASHTPHANAAAKTISYWVQDQSTTLKTQVAQRISQAGYHPLAATVDSQATLALYTTPHAGATPIQSTATGQPVTPLSGSTIIKTTQQPRYYLAIHPSVTTPAATLQSLATSLQAALTPPTSNTWSLISLGDIIFGRTVYLQMQRYGMLHPFANFSQTLASADLTLADLECSLSDSNAVVTPDGMTFVSPSQAAAGLQSSGIDAVNLANNHSYNGGANGYLDTITTIKNLGIGTFGGGANVAAARTPFITTVKGVRVALLGYSSIVGSVRAGADTPGMNYISMAPWGPFSEPDAAQMEADIKAAKTQADLVFVYYHWGTEYTHDANADQRTVAHRAIDAGADLILGTHPHWVQGVEWYHDKLITYSLGNFIFDQEWSTQTKQGTYLSAQFDGKRLIQADLIPYQIQDYNQPGPVTSATGQAILSDVFGHSWWPQP